MNLDMNIEHYTLAELETLYHLEAGYTLAHVLDGERELYKKLMRKVPDLTIQETIGAFLKQVTQRLLPIESEPEKEKEKEEPKPEKKTNPYVFTVDSMYRSTASKIHDFIYTLPEPMYIQSIQIECLDIPLVWNEFHKAQFYWNNISIHLPDGTYTPSEIEKLLYDHASIDVSIQNRTMIRSSEPFTIDFGKRFKSVGWILGFRREQYKSTYNVLTSKHELESEARFGYLTECMYVDVYDYYDTFIPDKIIENRSNYIMGYFPAVNKERIQKYNLATRVYPVPFRLERLRIQLFNKFGDPFLNQADFSIHFVINK
jgi:hypothetical protein